MPWRQGAKLLYEEKLRLLLLLAVGQFSRQVLYQDIHTSTHPHTHSHTYTHPHPHTDISEHTTNTHKYQDNRSRTHTHTHTHLNMCIRRKILFQRHAIILDQTGLNCIEVRLSCENHIAINFFM